MKIILVSGSNYVKIKKGSGALVVYGGHTFSKGGKRIWYCSRRFRGKCKAKLRIENDNDIDYQFSVFDHNHEPPSLYRTPDGSYIRL